MEERRAPLPETSAARDGLAIIYTMGYLAMMYILTQAPVPEANEKLLYTLAGIMSSIQLGVIKYYFDGSKGAEAAQQANIARSARTDSVVAGIASQAPAVAAAVVANAVPNATPVTPAPPLPDGTVPAAKADGLSESKG